MTQAYTDALRLVPVEPTEAMIFAGVLAAMEAATEFMEDDFWKERHLAAIERMKSGDYGPDDERAKGVKVGSTLYRAMLAAAPASPLPGDGWQDISTAPKDGTPFVGLKGRLAFRTIWQEYYVKWPHEEGGPTFRGQWTYEDSSAHFPWNPTHWMPLPAAPTGDA